MAHPQSINNQGFGQHCEITGTPQAATAAGSGFATTFTAVGQYGFTSEIALTFAIAAPTGAPDLAPITKTVFLERGVALREPIVFPNSGGDIDASGTMGCGNSANLPAGLSVGPSETSLPGSGSCQITGTPMTDTVGALVSVTGMDSGGMSDTATVTFVVQPAPDISVPAMIPAYTVGTEITETLKFAIVGRAYSGFLDVSDDVILCTASENLDSLGLTLDYDSANSRCEISGSPTVATDAAGAEVTVTATDQATGFSDSVTVTIVVNAS